VQYKNPDKVKAARIRNQSNKKNTSTITDPAAELTADRKPEMSVSAEDSSAAESKPTVSAADSAAELKPAV
jgi:hypothetical protein